MNEERGIGQNRVYAQWELPISFFLHHQLPPQRRTRALVLVGLILFLYLLLNYLPQCGIIR